MFWDEWYEQLEQMDPEDERWAEADAFIEKLQALLQHRTQQMGATLENALRSLHESCAEELSYFEMEDAVSWSVDLFPRESIADSVDDTAALRDALIEHSSIRLAKASTRQEEATKRSSLDSLDERIVALHKRMEKRAQISTTEDARGESSDEPVTADTELPVPPPKHDATLAEPPDTTTSAKQTVRPVSARPGGQPSRSRARILREQGKDAALESLRDRGILNDDLVDMLKGKAKQTSDEQDGEITDELLESVFGEKPAGQERRTASPAKEGSVNESRDDAAQEEPTVSADYDKQSDTQTVEIPAEPVAVSPAAKESGTHFEAGQLFHQLVFDGDLSGAYWLCRSLEFDNRDSFFPSWLLAALEAARCGPDRDRAAADDLLRLTTGNEIPEAEACQLITLAAAMYPALAAPHSNSAVWLNVELTYSNLRSLVDGIRGFSKHGRAVKPEDIGERRSRDEAEARLNEATRAAGSWLSEAPTHHTKLHRANRIWLKLVRPSGELHDLMQIAARDSRSDCEKLRKALAAWRDREQILGRIGQIDLELHGKKVRSIQASPRDQIVNWVFDACTLAEEWCRAVESCDSIQDGSTWIDEQVKILGRCVQSNLDGAVGEMRVLTQSDDICMSTAGLCVLDGLGRVADLFQCEFSDSDNHLAQNVVETFVLGRKGTVVHRLCSRLWLLPEIQFDVNGSPTSDTISSVRDSLALSRRELMSVRDAIEARMNQQDFRFAERLMEVLEEAEWAEVNELYQHLMESSRVSLKGHLSSIEIDIEKAVSDGVIVHADRSEYQGTISGIVPSEVELFAPEIEKLNRIRDDLQSRRRDRLASQRLDWQQKKDTLLRLANSVEGPKIRRFIEKSLENEDTRVVDECISRLQEAEHDAVEPHIDWFRASAAPRDVLADFLSKYLDLEKVLGRSSGDLRQILPVLGAKGKLPKPREDEASKALYAFRKLRQSSPKSGVHLRTHVTSIMDFIGLRSATIDEAIESIATRGDWAHFRAHISASGLALVPQFGSLRNEYYDLVCIWERPGAQTLGARINEAGLAKQPTIVLYLGRLKQNQRTDLARYCNRESLQALVVDEILLAFLAGERDARLPVALAAALPFTSINPYAPHSAGNVPPELFFGRDGMNRALQDFSGNGSCLVYGGRQLGKSALLRRVQREFHNPKQQRYAIYEDIRLVGDALASQSAEELWIRLRYQLNSLELFPRALTTDQPETLVRRVLALLEQNKQMRILLLLDEADSFLEQDAHQQFTIVSHLKRLMEDSQRRFKVVFAGLHNVQRFQGIPNQPFAHLGVPLQVGPLSPLAARELVKKPFEAVGYRFSDDSIVLRILSYTNCHPGLIQLFCSKLLNELNRRVGKDGSPPHMIDSNDIQIVYSDRKLEQDIRERFDWTLALDPRYQAIAWSIIEDQFEDRDSFGRPYTGQDISDLVNDNWPQGFHGISTEGMRGLLDEMCGLGVLVRAEEGYRLRSPNLVHLMGTQEDIFARLVELSERDAVTCVFNTDVHRESLWCGQYSPFTHAQARSLAKQSVGACLVFGSNAQGLARTTDAIARFLPNDLPDGVLGKHEDVPDSITDGEQLAQWLEDHWQKYRKYNRLLVTNHVSANSLAQGIVPAALEFCRRHQKSRASWIRVFLVFDPAASWRWMENQERFRKSLEDRADAVIALSLWAREAIQLRLTANEKMDTEAICQQVERVTGGWPFLLDELFEKCGDGIDPKPAIDQIELALGEEGDLRSRFRAALGVDGIGGAMQLLALVQPLDEPIDRALLLEFAEEKGIPSATALAATEFLLRMCLLEEHLGEIRIQKQVATVLTSL